jgi:retron-type reverse transcriptase
MKTFRHLYSQVYDFENLYRAYRAARQGKRSIPQVAEFELNSAENLLILQEELKNQTYTPGAYHSFYIHEPKRRLISAAPFRDRVVHHALCQVIEPIFQARFIAQSYANQKGKGTHRALSGCQHWARCYPYVLQCDVRQFFPSIDHAILRTRLAHWIRDKEVLWLIDQILASGVGVLAEEYTMQWFSGDDLFAINRPRGLPIGNLTSQFWANVYLDPLDQFVKHQLKCAGYVRYVDDFLLFAENKATLHQWREEIIRFLVGLRLTLHEARAQIYPVNTGIPFLGFRVLPCRRRLKRVKGITFQRRLKRLAREYAQGTLSQDRITASVQGWVAHARYAQSRGLCRAILGHMHLSRSKELTDESVPHLCQDA